MIDPPVNRLNSVLHRFYYGSTSVRPDWYAGVAWPGR